MVSSASSADSNALMQAMAMMQQKMSTANTDGVAGLSKDELSSIDSSNDTGGAAFLKSLTDQFDELDTDANGQLSKEEIAKAKPPEKMGPPPGLEISSSDDSSSSNSIEDIIQKLLKQLEESFTDRKKTASKASEDAATANPLANALKSADTDGTTGLSVDELTSIKSTEDTKKADFIKKLTENFDKLDSNSDGQLSQTEISAMKPEASANSGNLASGDNSFGSLAGSFLQKLMDSYKNGDLTKLVSSLSTSA